MISAVDARNLFTKKLLAVYRQKTIVTSFLRSFFPADFSTSKELSIEVVRNGEKIAVDVERGTAGNLNKFSRSTEKIFIPPFYWEYMVANDHRLYDVAIGMQSETAFTQLTNELAADFFELQKKIERALEVQCSQVLETGIVELRSQTNINFKRKAASLVNLSATPWTGSNDPYAHLETGANFLRQVGKAGGGVINVLMGSSALTAFLNNSFVKERADIRNFFIDMVRAPQKNSVGAALHGEVSAGSYNFRLWTYPEFYDNSSGVSTSYINPKKIILLPEAPDFKLGFAAVPQLITNGSIPQTGPILVQEFIDEKATAHEMHMKCAGVAIPLAVDQIWTAQVVA